MLLNTKEIISLITNTDQLMNLQTNLKNGTN